MNPCNVVVTLLALYVTTFDPATLSVPVAALKVTARLSETATSAPEIVPLMPVKVSIVVPLVNEPFPAPVNESVDVPERAARNSMLEVPETFTKWIWLELVLSVLNVVLTFAL